MAKATATPDAPDTKPEDAAPATIEPGQHNPTVHALLLQAKELQDEKKDHLERVEANRSSLRMLKRTGLLSPDQAKAIDAFYKPNTRPQNQAKAETAKAETANA